MAADAEAARVAAAMAASGSGIKLKMDLAADLMCVSLAPIMIVVQYLVDASCPCPMLQS